MECRVFEQPDGHLIITLFPEKARRITSVLSGTVTFETDQELMDRCTEKMNHKNLPYVDVDPKSLPDRKYRNKWRLNEDRKNIVIDGTLETIQEATKLEIAQLEDELNSISPDAIKILRHQREVEEFKKEMSKKHGWLARKKDTMKITSRLNNLG